MRVSHLAIDTGVIVPGTQGVVRVSMVKSIGTAEIRTELKINAEKRKGRPELEESGAIDRHWKDGILRRAVVTLMGEDVKRGGV